MNFRGEHMGLAARDPGPLKDWYVRVLDAKVVFDNGQSPPAFLLELQEGWWIEIYPGQFEGAAPLPNIACGWRHLAVRVDSIELARDLLQEKGVEFPDPIKPAGGGGRVLFFRDPEGNLLHLVERP